MSFLHYYIPNIDFFRLKVTLILPDYILFPAMLPRCCQQTWWGEKLVRTTLIEQRCIYTCHVHRTKNLSFWRWCRSVSSLNILMMMTVHTYNLNFNLAPYFSQQQVAACCKMKKKLLYSYIL